MTLTLKLSGWSSASESAAYSITADPELKDVTVNGKTFAKDAGFPTTGFPGATFTLNLTSGSVSDFIWKSDASWVSVTDGVVTFTKQGTGDSVIITGTPKSGIGEALTYNFRLHKWFVPYNPTDRVGVNWNDANAYCSSLGEQLPTREELSAGKEIRTIGALYAEWGNMSSYPGYGKELYWTSESSGQFMHYLTGLFNGEASYRDLDYDYRHGATCRKYLN